MNNRSIILLDRISNFPRDQVPFALRVDKAVNGAAVGSVQFYSLRCLGDYVRQLSRGDMVLPPVKPENGSCCAYLCVGYSDAIYGRTSPNLSKEALRYVASQLDRAGWRLKFVLPVIRSNRLSKAQKLHFAHIHKMIRDIVEEIDYAALIKVALEGADPTSPSGDSIIKLANALGHDISIRAIKDVVARVDRPVIYEINTHKAAAPRNQDIAIKEQPKKGRIIITEEAPVIRRRRKKNA